MFGTCPPKFSLSYQKGYYYFCCTYQKILNILKVNSVFKAIFPSSFKWMMEKLFR